METQTKEIRELHEYTDFINGYVYKFPLGECTNNGASSKFDRLYVVSEEVTLPEVIKLCSNNPVYHLAQFFKVDYDFYDRTGYVRLDPINKGGKWNMAGGNYLYSSDSRFKDFVCGNKYPVPIHDRFEN